MSKRILGIDPGLTRCGAGVVDYGSDRRMRMVHVEVIRTAPGTELPERLHSIGSGIERLLDAYEPQVLAIERVFAEQRNLNTVMGVAQVIGIAIREAQRRGIRAQLHTPSEVKAAVSGYGQAEKAQVAEMVRRILRLTDVPKPADAADALALAICAAWKTPLADMTPSARTHGSGTHTKPTAESGTTRAMTPAQEAWLAAERASKSGRGRLR